MVNNYLMGKDPSPFDLLYWNSDSAHAGQDAHRNMYGEQTGRTRWHRDRRHADRSIWARSRSRYYFISAIEDHIAPWKSTYIGSRNFGGPVRFVPRRLRHIAGIVNRRPRTKYGYWINASGKLPENVDAWF